MLEVKAHPVSGKPTVLHGVSGMETGIIPLAKLLTIFCQIMWQISLICVDCLYLSKRFTCKIYLLDFALLHRLATAAVIPFSFTTPLLTNLLTRCWTKPKSIRELQFWLELNTNTNWYSLNVPKPKFNLNWKKYIYMQIQVHLGIYVKWSS